MIENTIRYRFKTFSLLWILALCLASPEAFADKASQQRMNRLLLLRCREGNAEKVAELLAQGADPNASLASVAQGGHLELAKLLLAAGGNVDGLHEGVDTPLHLAASQGGPEMVKLLLVNQADVNRVNEVNEIPLHKAVSGDSDIRVVKLLVRAGAKMDVANDEGITPVRLAAIGGVKQIYDWLVAANGGTEPRARIVPAATSNETTAELVKMLSSKKRKDRITAQRKLVTHRSAIMSEVLASIQAGTPINHFFELFAALGPEAETALPMLVELLADKHYVSIARLTIDRMKPGHFAQLPVSVREQADVALYQAVTDPQLEETAGYFLDWLSEKSQLKLLRSQQAKHRALGVRVMGKLGQPSPEIEMELINILGSKDELFSTRRNAARTLGRSGKLSEVAKSALLDILKASPPYDSDLSTEEREQRQQLCSLSQEAGRALGAAGPSIIDDLLPLVTPLENPFRPGAMEALVRLGPEGVPRLAELLAHRDEAVRVSASVALNRIGKPSVPALIAALKSKNDHILEGALSAFWWIGQSAKDAIPELRAMIVSKKQPDSIAIAACCAALKIDPQNSQLMKDASKLLPTLIRAFEGKDIKSQVGAIEVLRQLGPNAKESIPTLQKYLERQDLDNESNFNISVIKGRVSNAIQEIEGASVN